MRNSILVADTDIDVIQQLILCNVGQYHLIVATTEAEALEILHDIAFKIKLVITDNSKYNLIKECERLYPVIKLVLSSTEIIYSIQKLSLDDLISEVYKGLEIIKELLNVKT